MKMLKICENVGKLVKSRNVVKMLGFLEKMLEILSKMLTFLVKMLRFLAKML